jgi:PhzF family phenazine biosynthesis protein
VPTCGHATIAAMYVKAIEENLNSAVYRYKTKIGVLPFEIIKTNGDYKITMTQGSIDFEEPLTYKMKSRITDALNLSKGDLDERCPVQIVSTGHSKVMIGIKRRSVLNGLNPNFFELAQSSKEINCNGYFVFTFESDSPNILTHGRMFAPAIGINEDPVTGNANGPLGAYIVKHKLAEIKGDEFSFIGMQGEAIKRPGEIEVNVKIVNDKPALVKISGNAVVVFKTEIEV